MRQSRTPTLLKAHGSKVPNMPDQLQVNAAVAILHLKLSYLTNYIQLYKHKNNRGLLKLSMY